MNCIVLLAVFMAALAVGAPKARAQYGDPFQCLPPVGQGMWEIASTNLARRYRSDPTAENKEAMCHRFRSTVEVYENAVLGCQQSTCTTADFKDSCARAREKATSWRKRTNEECS